MDDRPKASRSRACVVLVAGLLILLPVGYVLSLGPITRLAFEGAIRFSI